MRCDKNSNSGNFLPFNVVKEMMKKANEVTDKTRTTDNPSNELIKLPDGSIRTRKYRRLDIHGYMTRVSVTPEGIEYYESEV